MPHNRKEVKMKRVFLIILTLSLLVTSLLGLSACKGEDDGVPEGMQLVRGGDEVGYYFYAPEEWTVSCVGDIACAYVSKLDSTSVTLVRAEKPEGELSDYFDAEMKKLPFEVTVLKSGEKTAFGNVTDAYKYTYSYEYDGATVGVMQIFLSFEDSFYIFTYSSFLEQKLDGVSYYDFYLEKVSKVIESARLVSRTGEASKPEYETDADGYNLVSDKSIAGFSLYLPKEYEVAISSGLVSASRTDGANISLTKATFTRITRLEYWEQRKADLEPIIDKVTLDGEEKSSLVELVVDEKTEVKNSRWAYLFEYTYALEGVTYHVYQVIITTSNASYVFTYTATEDVYGEHLDEIKTILEKLGF